ncbi:MAG: hypothetical protein RLN62_05230 [Rickettsiales bacterium]
MFGNQNQGPQGGSPGNNHAPVGVAAAQAVAGVAINLLGAFNQAAAEGGPAGVPAAGEDFPDLAGNLGNQADAG